MLEPLRHFFPYPLWCYIPKAWDVSPYTHSDGDIPPKAWDVSSHTHSDADIHPEPGTFLHTLIMMLHPQSLIHFSPHPQWCWPPEPETFLPTPTVMVTPVSSHSHSDADPPPLEPEMFLPTSSFSSIPASSAPRQIAKAAITLEVSVSLPSNLWGETT